VKTVIGVESFNLDLTLESSFFSTFSRNIRPKNWVKVAGHLGNCSAALKGSYKKKSLMA